MLNRSIYLTSGYHEMKVMTVISSRALWNWCQKEELKVKLQKTARSLRQIKTSEYWLLLYEERGISIFYRSDVSEFWIKIFFGRLTGNQLYGKPRGFKLHSRIASVIGRPIVTYRVQAVDEASLPQNQGQNECATALHPHFNDFTNAYVKKKVKLLVARLDPSWNYPIY